MFDNRLLQSLRLREQYQASWRILLLAYIPALAILLIVALQTNYDIRFLMSDPYVELGLPMLTGAISNILILVWTAAAAVCLFTAWLSTGRERAFFAASGSLTTLLLVDDFFALHECVLDKQLGVPEKVTFGLLGLIFVVYVVVFLRELLHTNYLQMVLVVGMLGMAFMLDMVIPDEVTIQVVGPRLQYWPEETLEALAIVGWAAFYIQTCARHVQQHYRPVQSPIYAR
jgi:hypothetical protein